MFAAFTVACHQEHRSSTQTATRSIAGMRRILTHAASLLLLCLLKVVVAEYEPTYSEMMAWGRNDYYVSSLTPLNATMSLGFDAPRSFAGRSRREAGHRPKRPRASLPPLRNAAVSAPQLLDVGRSSLTRRCAPI